MNPKPATELEINTFELLRQKKFNEAYIMVAEYEATHNTPRGLANNWSECAKNGLRETQLVAYQTAFARPIKLSPIFQEFENDIRAIAILIELLGKSRYLPNLFNKLSDYTGFNQKLTKELRAELYSAEYTIVRYLSTLLHLESYITFNFKFYELMHISDDKICEYCKSMGNLKFKVESAEIGVNCPPFHDKCRCAIAPST